MLQTPREEKTKATQVINQWAIGPLGSAFSLSLFNAMNGHPKNTVKTQQFNTTLNT